jgi:nucleotide-binding universal stress UspA family protein
MDYKDILIHIDGSPSSAQRLEVAISIAKKRRATLTGLYVVSHPPYQPQGAGVAAAGERAEKLFRAMTDEARVPSAWIAADWGVAGVSMSEVVNYYSHTRDLIVLGQTSSARASDVPADLPARVILGSGRPVLVVPHAGSFPSVGERVIIAWKAGRESTRAANDAMPFLAGSRQVSVLTIHPPGAPQPLETDSNAEFCLHLKRHHGIEAQGENLVTGEIPVADILMNYAWENGCDLLVMGAYAHRSRGSFSVGSAALQLLEHMTLPVLFSH